MAHRLAERYEVRSTTNTLNVPAVVKEQLGVGYNDEIEVTIYLEQLDNVNKVSFTNFIQSNGTVTIPVRIRRSFDLDDRLEVSFAATGEHFDVSHADGTVRTTVFLSAHEQEGELPAVSDVLAKFDDAQGPIYEFDAAAEESLAEFSENMRDELA